jgi:hypothetical protein
MALTRPRYSQIPDTDWKQSVRVATTADVGNVMLAVMPNTVDGVTLNFYDRVLLRSQANAAQNGIYYVKAVGTGANGIWERTKDASSGGALGAVTPSIVTQVEEGTVNKNRTFKLTTTGNIELGTTDLSFGVQAAEPAGATGQLQFANVNNVIGGATTTSYDYVTGNLVLTGNVNTTLLYQNGKRVPQVFTSATPPSTPAVGDQWYQVGTDILYEWLQDGATAYWIDVSGATIANINPITGQNIGTLVVNGGNDSTSTNTGALQVVGGVGITGNLNVGGSVSFGGGQLGSDLVISSNTTSVSETTGAIRIASPGGLGVGGNIWAGGAIVANSRIPSTSITTGAIVLPGTGGLGIGGNVWVGQDVNVVGNITGGGVRQTISSTAPANPTVGDQWYQLGTDILYQYVSDGTGKYWVDIAGATVANISAQSQQSLTDIQIVSGTPSTSASTGALTVSGGVGIQGNLNIQGGFNITGGNLVANQNVTSTDTTTGSMVITSQGGLGVGGNINVGQNVSVGGNLSIAQSASFLQNVTISANLVAGGSYFSAAGLSVTNGNIVTTGTSAQIGGLTISNGAVTGLASLGVTGSTSIGADLAVTGNITGGGLRKYAQINAPTNPIVGDVWYKTDTDVFYQYVNDGTSKYWIDFTSATVSNTNPLTASLLNDLSIQSTTPATSTTSGALQVAGGVGITGNVFAGNLSTSTVTASNFTYANGVSILVGNEGTYSNANVTAYLTARTTTISDGFLSTAGMTVTAGNLKTASANIGGLIIEAGGLSSLSSLSVIGAGSVGGDFAVTGNITGGGIRKTSSVGAPVNPVVGDTWYKTDTDVLYTYINDGTKNIWVDYTSASVSNANPTSPQSLSDLQIVSGTASTNTTSGALQVTGGAGITGNVFTGNLSTSTVSATNFTFANGVSILAGNEGTYSNANVTAYLAASNISVGGSISATGNLTASGSFFSAGGLSVTAGNILATGARAVIGGLTIENGGISSLASLNVIGSGTLGGDFAITGNITAGGLRKYAQVGAPANPVVGDVWYKTDTDVFYQYVNDGTNKYWIDYTSATVSNANPTSPQSLQDLQIVSGTPSTGLGTGALQVTGGAAVTGNVFTGNLSTTTVAASNFTYANGVSILTGNEGTYSNANVTAYLTARSVTIADGNITATGGYLAAGGFVATAGNIRTTSANIGGVIIESGGIGQLASLGVLGAATIGGDLAVTGNITGGGLRKYAQIGAPANPVVGDVWYKTDTDVYYQYINDGTNKYWIDYSSATVSNASPTSPQSLQDLQIVSGTASTSTSTGALIVQGGAGISGNVFTGNLSTSTVAASNFTYANGTSIFDGYYQGTYSNANVTAYLTARTTTISDGFLSTAGMTVTAGNLRTTSANIGGVVIEAGGISSLASLNVIGGATIGGDVVITGNVTGGGIRKSSSVSAPANPVVGDQWYKTDTDTLYQYINDGTSRYWIDVAGATVSNASITSSQIAYDIVVTTDTQSTSTTTGAVRVQGGIGLIGNIYTTGIADIGGNLTAGNILANNNLQTNTLAVVQNATVGGTLNVTGAVATGNLTTGNITGFGFTTAAGNLTAAGAYFSAGGMSATSGNISIGNIAGYGFTVSNGNVTATGTRAVIGGLEIINGGFGNLASLGVTGAATFGANVDITGRVTGGGIRKTSSATAPTSPIVGDTWYKTDTDTLYQYINDGTSNYWIDVSGATVANISPQTSQTLNDIVIVSGTPATNTTSGALQVQGGAGITGNVFAGNLSTATVSATAFTFANGVSILAGNEGTYSNANVIAYLTARSVAISDAGNITTSGTFFNTAGLTVLNGNVTATGTTATIGGLVINNGSLPSLPSIGVVGAATIGGDLAVTGNITGGGLRKYAQINAPANPVVGDVWYKTDTDVYYQYINDGTNKYWVDYAGATVSNASITSSQIAYDIVVTTDTQSTSTTTGAIRVQGGIGLIGNIYTTGIADFGGNLRAGNITANNNLQTATLQVTNNANVSGDVTAVGNIATSGKITATGNITSGGTYFSAGGLSVTAGNLVNTGNLYSSGTKAVLGGLTIENGAFGNVSALGVIGAATFGANVDITGNVNITRDIVATGNIVAGGVRKYAQTSKPTNAVPGDVWYKTDTDVYYTYVNDGTSSYWIDYVGATVSNAAVDNSVNQNFTIASGTASTDPTTGALVVVGGVGVTGDINTTGDFTIDGTFTACTAVTAGYLNVADGIDSYGNVIIHGPGTANYTVQVRSSDAADDVLGIKTSVAGGGFAIDSLNSELIGATPFGINANTFSIGIKNGVGTTVQADAFKLDTAGNASVAKTLSVGQHVNVTGNVNAGVGTFTSLFASSANLTTLNLSGTLTVPTLNVTTSINAPGIRKYAQTTAPSSPAVGDVWYKTDTDVYYTYVNDGTTNYWIDYVGATVSNAATTASQSVDLRVASGTESTNTDTGAITVVGGVGVVGNIFAGGIVSAQGQLRAISGVQSTSTTTGALVITGGLGVSANTNIGGALAADSLRVAGPTNLSGNLSGTNLSLTGRADIIGGATIGGYTTIGGNLDVTGRVTGGGVRKTTSLNAPDNPVVGDVWYKTDTDVLYQYVNDGASNYWIDYVGPTVSNASPSTGLLSDLEIVTGTPSTSTITGAARITGGVGITENLYVGGLATIGANLVANNITANLNLQSATLAVTGAGTVGGNLSTANLSTGIATIARADIAGALAVGGDVTVTGNIVAGGVRKTQSTTAPVNPTVGDLWYKTDTDVYYQYTSDGTNKYWIDYVGATVSNAAVQNSSSVDFTITSGTESTNTTTGALTIIGGVGITGNVFAGNATATSFRSDNFVFANGQPLSSRITGTFSNVNVAAYLTGSITTGNISAGNITALDITARDVTLSGNITGGGLRKYAQLSAPANPVVGDVWYKTDTDVYYQYINDGTNNYWVDYIGATISNATVNNSTNSDFLIASGTLSTSNSTGALQVVGGVGVVGNVNLGGNLKADGTVTGTAFTYANGVSILVGNEGTYSNANVTAYLTARNVTIADGNITATGGYLSAGGFTATAGNIFAPSANIGGVVISNGGLSSLASLGIIGSATVGADLAVTGNITGGGLRKTQSTTAPLNPVQGDVWYKTDTDVYYQYINDGTASYWIDYSSATVSNANPTSPQSLQDLQIVSGTPSTSTSTGALQVIGGAGISGNVTAGNVVTSQLSADNFTYANGVSIFNGYYQGTYSNANVTAYLTARTTTISDGFLSTAGMTVTAGNLKTASANIGGLIIENSGISSLASLGIIGSATIGADLAVTGNITGGGLRKYAQDTAPATPVVGDVWYKTDTDVYYQYINDGTNKYWVDYVGATVSNASITSSQIAYDIVVTTDTQSTSTTTGAIRVQGGIGLIGNIYTTGIADIGGNLTAGNITANNNLQTNTLAVINNATVGGTLNVTSALSSETLATGNSTVGNIAGYGFTTNAGNLTATGAYFAAGGMSSTNGNITVGNISGYSFIVSNGNITSTGTYARVGGLEIINGGFTNLASLGVVGSVNIGGNVAVTGNIMGGGLRKTQSTTAPTNPVQGDIWYKTDSDIYYQYINDGTSSFWVDYTSATVANITQNAATVSDLQIVSGTPSTSSSTGALTVAGGVGITGDIYTDGNLSTGQISSGSIITNGFARVQGQLDVFLDAFIQGNTITIQNNYTVGDAQVDGNVLLQKELRVGGNVTAYGLSVQKGNLVANGAYFSAGGLTSTAGNVTLGNIVGYGFSTNNGNLITTGTRAVVGGLTIENGAFGNVASLGVIGSATIGNDLAVTGNITGGGIRKTQSTTAPVNPVQGDVWYKTDTDVFYQYVNDGTNTYWIDYTSATVANISTANAQYGTDVGFVSGTLSTDQTTGAVVVIGGVGITGNINLTGQVTALDTITGQRIVSNTSVTAQTLSLSGNATLGNITGYGFSTNNGNVTATGTLTVGGTTQIAGNLSATGSYFSAGGLSVTAGNITGYGFSTNNGNVTATGTYAQIGGLVIQNGGFGSLASLDVVGAVTFGANLDVTGRVTGGGIRKTSSIGAPVNPVVGDQWYKTDTDILYQYINDGTSNYWIDTASAAVANVTVSAETVGDLEIVSGTPSTDPTTGALRVAGGVGVAGDVNISANITAGNVLAGKVYSTNVLASTFTYPNGASILDGYYFGTYSNANVGGYLTAQGIGTTSGNLTASGAYFSAGGLTSTAGAISATSLATTGNIVSQGIYAKVGGLEIINGGFGSIASLNVIGATTIGGNLAVTGNITGGGLRKYTGTTTPANPVVGDVWYKSDTDIYYQYIDDGTNKIWVDYVSATVADLTLANAQLGYDIQFVSGTTSTSQTTGAVTVIGGVGVTGNINLTGRVTALDTITGQRIVSNTNIAGATLSIAGDTTVGNLTAGNITGYGFSTNNGNVVATGKLTVGGLSVVPGNLSATGSYLAVDGFTALNGNITATGTTATIGGLTIANGGFGSIASLDVIGGATIGGNVTITGNVVGGGIRKTTSISAPASPTVGDQWYKTDTDILYQFMDDGTNTYWVDFASATVANITNDFDGLGDFQTIGNVIGNGIVSDNYYYANGVSFVTTTVANTQNIVANITNGFNLGLDLTPTGVAAGNYGSATSIPTVVVDDKGRVTSITSNSVSTTFGLVGNVGASSINGGNTLVVVGVPNQISTTVTGNTISIGFTPNITFTDFTVSGNLIYQGGGIKTTTSPTPPTGPTNGDMWYQSGTDILYRYVFDGTNEYWLDLFSTPLRAILPSRDIAGGDGEVQFNNDGEFGANVNFAFDKTTGTLKVERFRITKTQSPATPGSPGITGEITWDGNWMYVCVAPNSWVRAGLYTW